MFVPFAPFKVVYKKRIWDVICVDSDTETVTARITSKEKTKFKDEDDIAEEEKIKEEQIQITTTRLLIGIKGKSLIWKNLEQVKFFGINVNQNP